MRNIALQIITAFGASLAGTTTHRFRMALPKDSVRKMPQAKAAANYNSWLERMGGNSGMTATYYFNITKTSSPEIRISLIQKFRNLQFGTFTLYTFLGGLR